MGNCITIRKPNVLSEDDNNRRQPNNQVEKTAAPVEIVGRSTSTFPAAADFKVKRSVRFRHGEEEKEKERKGKSGVVRIKLVLTQKELDRILNGGDEDEDQEKDSSAERLLMKAINVRSRSRISEEYGKDYQWKPSLESIPEEII